MLNRYLGSHKEAPCSVSEGHDGWTSLGYSGKGEKPRPTVAFFHRIQWKVRYSFLYKNDFIPCGKDTRRCDIVFFSIIIGQNRVWFSEAPSAEDLSRKRQCFTRDVYFQTSAWSKGIEISWMQKKFLSGKNQKCVYFPLSERKKSYIFSSRQSVGENEMRQKFKESSVQISLWNDLLSQGVTLEGTGACLYIFHIIPYFISWIMVTEANMKERWGGLLLYGAIFAFTTSWITGQAAPMPVGRETKNQYPGDDMDDVKHRSALISLFLSPYDADAAL